MMQRSRSWAVRDHLHQLKVKRHLVNSKSKTSMWKQLFQKRSNRNLARKGLMKKKSILLLLHKLSMSTLKRCSTESSTKMSMYKNQSEKNGDNRLKVEKLYNWMTLLLNKWYPKDPHKRYKKKGSNQRKLITLMRKKGKVHTMKNIMKMISKTSWKRWYRNRLKTMLIVTMTQTLTKVNLLRTILSSQKKAKKVQGFKTQVSSSPDSNS